MLPATARANDVVEVTNPEHGYYGIVGKIVSTSNEGALVTFFKEDVFVVREDLSMKARVGTSKHMKYLEQMSAKLTDNLIKEDYDSLINYAIDIKDWVWANSLIERRDGL